MRGSKLTVSVQVVAFLFRLCLIKIAGNLFSPLAYKQKTINFWLMVFWFVRDERLELPTFAV